MPKQPGIGTCAICDRPLDKDADPLSNDCGGDCWGCVGEAEARGGHPPSIVKVAEESGMGLRNP